MHEYEHDHDHAHHCHPHSHEHTGDKPMSPEEVLALLNYMLDHNRHHADELHDICHALEDEGKEEPEAVRSAVHSPESMHLTTATTSSKKPSSLPNRHNG